MKYQNSKKSAHRAMALVAIVGAVIHIASVNAQAQQQYYTRQQNGKCPPGLATGKLTFDNWSATAGVKVGVVGANGTYRSSVGTASVCVSDPNIRDVRGYTAPPDPRRQAQAQQLQIPTTRPTFDVGFRQPGSMSVRTTTPATTTGMFRR